MVKRKKIIKIVCIILLLIVVAVLIVLGVLWNLYLNKNNLIKKFESPQGQEVYVLGTLHDTHFNKWANYSVADILGAIENVKPDVVLIEAREKYFEAYGAVDGPIDMAIAYSYCIDNDVPTALIDWWEVDNNFQASSTNKLRDDMIFTNIQTKLTSFDDNAKVMVICGAGHLYEQSKRFADNGYKKLRMQNANELFAAKPPFAYPASASDVWEKRAYFYAYTYPEIIEKTENLDVEIKQQFTGGNHDGFYKEQLQYNELFSAQQLYK